MFSYSELNSESDTANFSKSIRLWTCDQCNLFLFWSFFLSYFKCLYNLTCWPILWIKLMKHIGIIGSVIVFVCESWWRWSQDISKTFGQIAWTLVCAACKVSVALSSIMSSRFLAWSCCDWENQGSPSSWWNGTRGGRGKWGLLRLLHLLFNNYSTI